MISKGISNDIPRQMNILNMVMIPILMHFLRLFTGKIFVLSQIGVL